MNDKQNKAEQNDDGCVTTMILMLIAGALGGVFPVIWLIVFAILAIMIVRQIIGWIKK